MNGKVTATALLIGLSATLATPPAHAQMQAQRDAVRMANDLSLAFQRASRLIAPSVVNITARQRVAAGGSGGSPELDEFLERFFGGRAPDNRGGQGEGRSFESIGQGSGVIVKSDGYILTNNHVVEGAVELKVTLPSGRQYDAELIGTDEETDLAVIKIDVKGLEPADFADSDEIKVGQWVLAVGNPFGLDNTVTAGIVSAVGRPAMGLAEYGNLIQTDAAINPGNSGGPLVNLDGEVIGINNAITTQTGGYMGIGFAIPANMASSVLDSLLESGEVVRGWLGITMRPLLPEEAESVGYQGRGVIVINVSEGSPAESSGLAEGDIITALNGRPVDTSSQLQNAVARRAPGTTIDMSVLREGRALQVPVTLGERPPLALLRTGQSAARAFADLGLIVGPLTQQRAEELGADSSEGVLVLGVEPGGFADELNIRADDIIVRFDGASIRTVDDLSRATVGFDPDGSVRIEVLRRGRRRTFAVE